MLYIIVQQNYSILQHSAYAARYITLQYHCTTRSTGIQEYSSSNYRTQCLRCTVVLHISKYRGCATMQYSTVVGVLCYVVLRVGTALCSNPQRCVYVVGFYVLLNAIRVAPSRVTALRNTLPRVALRRTATEASHTAFGLEHAPRSAAMAQEHIPTPPCDWCGRTCWCTPGREPWRFSTLRGRAASSQEIATQTEGSNDSVRADATSGQENVLDTERRQQRWQAAQAALSQGIAAEGEATPISTRGPVTAPPFSPVAPTPLSHDVSTEREARAAATAPAASSAAAAASSQARNWERLRQELSRGEALTRLALQAAGDPLLAEELFAAASRHEAAVAILPIGSTISPTSAQVVPSLTEERLRANGTVWFGSRTFGGRYFLVLEPCPGRGRERAGLHFSLDTWWKAVLITSAWTFGGTLGGTQHVHPLSRTARVDTLEVAEEIWLAHGFELPVPLHVVVTGL